MSAELFVPFVILIFEEAETERFAACGTEIFAEGLNETLVFWLSKRKFAVPVDEKEVKIRE